MPRWNKTELSQADQFHRKRQAVIREAARAFAKRGYHNTSLEDVAKALDVSKPALYTYVKTKQEILFEVHQSAMDFGERALDEALAMGENGAGTLEAFVQRYVHYVAEEEGIFAIVGEVEALTPGDRSIIAGRRDAFEKRFKRILQTGVKDGSLESVDAKVAVFAFFGALHWVARWFNPGGRLRAEDMSVKLADILMRGVVRRPPASQRP